MTLLDGGGNTGGSGEVTTLSTSRSVFHRNGLSSNNKKHIGSTTGNFSTTTSDINANNTTNSSNNGMTNGSSSGGVQRVPEIQTKTEDGSGHDLKKWSDVCKMNSPSSNGYHPPKRSESSLGNSSNGTNGDSNNNHSSDGSVLPDMDFSN